LKLNEAIALWEQVDPLSLSKWADAFAYLSPESAHEPGRWKTLPYQKEIMDAFTDPTVEKITVKKSARVGYTKILNNIIGYSIHHDPRSVLVVQPTVEDAQGYSKDEIAPMLRDTPVLQGLVSEAKTRDSSNTILKKTYPGGSLMLIGANSPRGFRRISVPIVLFDEVNGYPVSAGSEGDQIKLGTKRSEWYWNRKIVIGSTPSIKGCPRSRYLLKSQTNDIIMSHAHIVMNFSRLCSAVKTQTLALSGQKACQKKLIIYAVSVINRLRIVKNGGWWKTVFGYQRQNLTAMQVFLFGQHILMPQMLSGPTLRLTFFNPKTTRSF